MQADVPDWLSVSRETLDQLTLFASEVIKWNPAINLVSKSSVAEIWHRHILDSAQIYPDSGEAGVWLDIGSGAGFPGVVMAIMGAQNVTLVEVDQRKATFLREVARKLHLPIRVISARVEEIPPLGAQTMSARALAPLTDLLAHASRHLQPDGRAIFPKGRGFHAELQAAQQNWSFDCTEIQSKTDTESAILIIKNIAKR